MRSILLFAVYLVFVSCGGNLKAGQSDQTRTVDSPEMVFVDRATFEMGTEDGEFDEGPVHKVTLSEFYIGKYEVTVAQYRRFAQATDNPMPDFEEWGGDDNHPVTNVSWSDAEAYTRWLSEKTGENYRLPTEAEWYYVASDGGTKIKYPWGDGEPDSNIADESLAAKGESRFWKSYDDKFAYLAPVGSFKANSLGIHDLGGNAAEWLQNFHYEFSKAPQSDPTGPSKGKNRVFKGGSFRTNAWYSRIAQRNFMPETFRKDYLGFRIVKEAEKNTPK